MIGSCLNRIIIYTFLGIALLCSCEKKMKVVKNENYEQFAGKMIVIGITYKTLSLAERV